MHQPTVRVLEVLNYITKSNTSVRLADLSRELSIPKSTLVPIMQTLCQYGYISQNAGGEYSSGKVLFSIGSQLKGRFPVLDYVGQKLDKIVSLLGETCYFGVLDGGYVLYLDRKESPNPLRMLVSTGKRLPAYATGIGKALIMDKTKSQLHMLYPQGLKKLTPATIDSVDKLCTQLKTATDNGFTEEIEESTEHIRCFGVPIHKHGKIIAAISVAIPVFRYDDTKREYIIKILKDTASQIAQTISETDAELI